MLELLRENISILPYPHPVQRCNSPIHETFLEEHEVCLQQLRLQTVAGDDRRLHHVVDERADYQQYLQRQVYFIRAENQKCMT